jgi:hypothetical protein
MDRRPLLGASATQYPPSPNREILCRESSSQPTDPSDPLTPQCCSTSACTRCTSVATLPPHSSSRGSPGRSATLSTQNARTARSSSSRDAESAHIGVSTMCSIEMTGVADDAVGSSTEAEIGLATEVLWNQFPGHGSFMESSVARIQPADDRRTTRESRSYRRKPAPHSRPPARAWLRKGSPVRVRPWAS